LSQCFFLFCGSNPDDFLEFYDSPPQTEIIHPCRLFLQPPLCFLPAKLMDSFPPPILTSLLELIPTFSPVFTLTCQPPHRPLCCHFPFCFDAEVARPFHDLFRSIALEFPLGTYCLTRRVLSKESFLFRKWPFLSKVWLSAAPPIIQRPSKTVFFLLL